ncbi:MAG: 3'(2'),5'-bisphosphate nucleotidase CysQ, partial [Hyphomicrobiales bacterium]|nr:3'(2'),5'-bisphosphate nucleotidase CysQ [Hyphomicrobiales bacterium]
FATPDARDWDVAAADLLLEEAGGTLTTLDGARLVYNRDSTRHPALVAGGVSRHEALLARR